MKRQERKQQEENRRRLAAATAAYFEALSPEALAEEEELGRALSACSAAIDIDRG